MQSFANSVVMGWFAHISTISRKSTLLNHAVFVFKNDAGILQKNSWPEEIELTKKTVLNMVLPYPGRTDHSGKN